MKVIDKKGRLFGKVNVIDFIVFIVILCFIPMLIFSYRMLTEKPVRYEKLLYLTLKFEKVIPEIAPVIKEGDIAIDNADNDIGEITEILSSAPSKVYVIPSVSKDISTKHPDETDIFVKARILTEQRSKHRYYYNNKPVKVGLNIAFETKLYRLPALIVSMSKTDND